MNGGLTIRSSLNGPHAGCLGKEGEMPEETAIQRAKEDAAKGESPSTQAGEFVRDEIHHVREGVHGARSAKQAIAIGLSKARRAGIKLPPPKKGAASSAIRRQASRTRSRATLGALRRESTRTASHRQLAAQTRASARRRGRAARHRASMKAVRTKGPAGLQRAARKAARTRRKSR